MWNKSIDVHWVPIAGKTAYDMRRLSTVSDMLWFEPEPVLKHIVQERDKHVAYLKCPAFTDVYKNVFMVRSPMDITLSVVRDDKGNCIIREHSQSPEFFNDFIMHRTSQNSRFPMASISIGYLLYSEKSVELEVMHPTLSSHISTGMRGISLIYGKFDISKWIRPLEFAFEIHDDTDRIEIKRGDPLYYFRLHTDKKVNFVRKDINSTEPIFKIIESSLSVKSYIAGNSLEQNYKLAEPLLKRSRDKLFGKKCPFGFGK